METSQKGKIYPNFLYAPGKPGKLDPLLYPAGAGRRAVRPIVGGGWPNQVGAAVQRNIAASMQWVSLIGTSSVCLHKLGHSQYLKEYLIGQSLLN